MMPGPGASVSCPSCGASARYRTALSGNTFGATYWTDGRRVAPMLAELAQFVRCGSCASYYWLRDVIGDDDVLIDDRADGDQLPHIEPANESEMLAALRAGQVVGTESERQLRVLAWWLSNDRYRAPGSMPLAGPDGLTEARRGNLRALLPLLDECDDNDMIMRAEIHRELGDFASAQRQLDEITDERFAAVIRQLRELCEAGDTQVRQLRFG